MIKVNCVVENVSKTGHPQIDVCSADNNYRCVEITMGSGKITVYADDLIQAIENCANNGHRRWRTAYHGVSNEDE